MAFDKYGRTEEETAAYSRALVDDTGWRRRSIADGALTFDEWRQRQRGRERARGDATTEAEVNAEMDRMFPGTGRQSRRGRDAAEKLRAELEASRIPPPGAAREIGRPTRPYEV